MTTDASYQRGVYRPQGGNKIVVGDLGRLSLAAGPVAANNPATGTLITHISAATLTGNDFAGSIVITTDGTGVAALAGVCTVTFANARTTAPLVFLTSLTSGTASTTLYAGAFTVGAVTTTTFTIMNTAALTASGTFTLAYQVVDVE